MMRTFMVGDKAHKVNSQPGDWLDDGAEVTITKVHDNGSVSVNHGGSIDLVVDVNKLQRVTPAATPPAAGEGDAGDLWTEGGITEVIAEAKVAIQRMNDTARAALEHGTKQNDMKADTAKHNCAMYCAELVDVANQLKADNTRLADELARARALLLRAEPLIGMLPADSRWEQQIPLLRDMWALLGMNKEQDVYK